MPVPITALYLAVFAVFACALAFPAGAQRGRTGISVGDGGKPELLLASRRHANFVEYVPYLMIMLGALELNGASATTLHVLGGSLFVARVLHAFGLKADTIKNVNRALGAGGTLLITLVAAGLLTYQFFTA